MTLSVVPKLTPGVGIITVERWALVTGSYMGIVHHRPSGIATDWQVKYPDSQWGPVTFDATVKTDVRIFYPGVGVSATATVVPLSPPSPDPGPPVPLTPPVIIILAPGPLTPPQVS